MKASVAPSALDRKSTRLNSSHTEIYTLSLHDALPIYLADLRAKDVRPVLFVPFDDLLQGGTDEGERRAVGVRSEEHTSELQSHRDLHSFPTRRSSDLPGGPEGEGRTARPVRTVRRSPSGRN